jgi:chromosome transmission fidelity protein 8
MPSIPLSYPSPTASSTSTPSPLPSLLQTPTGLALLEIQGTIHFPQPQPSEVHSSTTSPSTQTPIGTLQFPDYDPSQPEDKKWMMRVYFYVGEHQRLVGAVKALGKPLGVVRRRADGEGAGDDAMDGVRRDGEATEELEIIEIVRWKIVFGGRPEPV